MVVSSSWVDVAKLPAVLITPAIGTGGAAGLRRAEHLARSRGHQNAGGILAVTRLGAEGVDRRLRAARGEFVDRAMTILAAGLGGPDQHAVDVEQRYGRIAAIGFAGETVDRATRAGGGVKGIDRAIPVRVARLRDDIERAVDIGHADRGGCRRCRYRH